MQRIIQIILLALWLPSLAGGVAAQDFPTRAVRIDTIDDDELISELRAAGIEAGMVTTDNRVFFVGR